MEDAGANFYFGDGLQALLGETVERLLPEIIEQGAVTEEPDGAVLLAWPDDDFGVVVYIRAPKDSESHADVIAAWPFSRSGIPHDLAIESFDGDHDEPNIVLAHCVFGEVKFSAFDTFCLASTYNMSFCEDHVRAHLHGWAVALERAPTEPIVLLPDEVSASMREAFAEHFERYGKVTVETNQMAALLPYDGERTPLHQVQGVIRSVSEEKELLGLSFVTLVATVARKDDDTPMDIEITVNSGVWQGAWPQPGEAVRGVIWLQAIFSRPLAP